MKTKQMIAAFHAHVGDEIRVTGFSAKDDKWVEITKRQLDTLKEKITVTIVGGSRLTYGFSETICLNK